MGVGGRDVGDADVEVVQAGDLGAVAQVVALDEAFGALDVVEELDGEAERVDDADGVADAGRAFALLEAPHRSTEVGEELLRLVDVLGRADPVGDVVEGGDVALAQDEGVVGQLVGAAQAQGVGVLVLDVETEHVDPEPAGRPEVGDGELGVGGADHIRARSRGGSEAGGVDVAEATWTILDSV